MRRLFLWAGRLTMLLFAGGAVIAGIVALLAFYSLPDYDTDVAVPHISAPVDIVRDANAVPHISGQTDTDVFFGLGFVHAQDRIWQMNMARRLAQGRLSEILGERTLNRDILMRSLDLDVYARAIYDNQPAETQAMLQAYANGVNSWITSKGGEDQESLSGITPEFLLSKSRMEPWQPHDSITLQKSMAFYLSSGAYRDIDRARFAATLPERDMRDLFASDLDVDSTAWKKFSALPSDIQTADMQPYDFGASNAWAVDATRTAYGASLLASDPHLNLQAPAVWYMAHLRLGETNVIGATIPGIPIVSIGHNGTVSWGITASQIDDQDVYLEQLNPKNPEQYLEPDGFADFQMRDVTIGIKDVEPVTHTLRWSRHGPILPETAYGLGNILPEGYRAALQWAALTPNDSSLTAALSLMRAQSLRDARNAAQDINSPSLNFVLADKTRVAMVTSGRIPRRSVSHTTQGRLPAEGWLPKNDWLGFMDTIDKPRTINPRSGAVANANNRTTDAAYPAHLSHDWAEPYRIKRIDKLLNSRDYHTLKSFSAMQNDTVSEMARSLLPLVGTNIWWDTAGKTQQQIDVLNSLKAWNGDMNEHQMEPLVFVTWMRALTHLITQDELGPLQKVYTNIKPRFLERVFRNTDGAGRWCDVVQTPDRETCATMAGIAFEQTLMTLSDRYGEEVALWRWGKSHQAVHRHTPFGYVPVLQWFFNIQHETSGGDETVMRGLTSGTGENPNANMHGSGFRMVVDFNDLQRSRFIVSTGQSGHPMSRYYDNLSELWRTGQSIPMLVKPDDIKAGSIGQTRLMPAPAQ